MIFFLSNLPLSISKKTMQPPRYSEITEIAGSHHKNSTNVRHIVQEELYLLCKKNDVNNANATKKARNMVDTEEFRRGLDNYFEEIDNKNRVCRCITFWSMVIFGVVTTFTIIMVQVFVNNGYQEFDIPVGFVTSTVNGIALAKSPLMNANDAIVYDGRDIVVPPKEKNALFITTSSYEVANQERGTCLGTDRCECLSPDQTCSQCAVGAAGTSGLYTGRCVKVSPDNTVPEDRRCEVTAWCPVLGYQHFQESQQGTIDPSMNMENVDALSVKLTVNTRFPKFQQSTQFNISTTVADLFSETVPGNDATKSSDAFTKSSKKGALFFIQFTYECDLDHAPASKCRPTMTATRMDDYTESEDGAQRGYGFNTVDYFSVPGKSTLSRRVRHLQGFRFIFDVTGRALKYNDGVLLTTIISGFGFAALAFVVVNEARLLCETTRATGKKD